MILKSHGKLLSITRLNNVKIQQSIINLGVKKQESPTYNIGQKKMEC